MGDEVVVAAPAVKPIWQSKTFWINLVICASGAVPGVQQVIVAHPELMLSAVGLLNIVLRKISHGKIELS